MASCVQRRLAKELQQLSLEPPAGVRVADDVTSNLRIWSVDVEGAPMTLYDGERFRLQFRFGDQYPFSSPEVGI
jgi:ubiquitin-conjugating enzyme E2 W